MHSLLVSQIGQGCLTPWTSLAASSSFCTLSLTSPKTLQTPHKPEATRLPCVSRKSVLTALCCLFLCNTSDLTWSVSFHGLHIPEVGGLSQQMWTPQEGGSRSAGRMQTRGSEARPGCHAEGGLGGVQSPTPCTWGPCTPRPCESPSTLQLPASPPCSLCDVMGLCDITAGRAGPPVELGPTGGSGGGRRCKFVGSKVVHLKWNCGTVWLSGLSGGRGCQVRLGSALPSPTPVTRLTTAASPPARSHLG